MQNYFRGRTVLRLGGLRLNQGNLRTLGLDPTKDYTQAELKQAYTRMAKQHHPDVSKLKDSQQKFQGIMKAYKDLLDEKERPQAYKEAQASQAWESHRASPSGQSGQYSQSYRQPNYSSDYDWSTNTRRSTRQTRYHRPGKSYRTEYWEYYTESPHYNEYERHRQQQQQQQQQRHYEREQQYQQDFASAQFFQLPRQIITMMAFFAFMGLIVSVNIDPFPDRAEVVKHHKPGFQDIGVNEPIGQFMERRSFELRGVPILNQKQCIAKGVDQMLALERAKLQRMPEEYARTVYLDLQQRKRLMRS